MTSKEPMTDREFATIQSTLDNWQRRGDNPPSEESIGLCIAALITEVQRLREENVSLRTRLNDEPDVGLLGAKTKGW